MTRFMIALAIGSAAIGGGALAQDRPDDGARRGGGMGMMRADANGDGVVTRAEYGAQVDARFARMDANGDGKIDGDETLRGRYARGGDAPPPPPPAPAGAGAAPPPPPPMLSGTRDQFRAAAMARFDRLDANRDGKIDAGEMQAMMVMRGARPGGPPPQSPPR
jgi:hypothetical protein